MGKKLDVNWNDVRMMYVKTDMTAEAVAVKFGICKATVVQKCWEQKWRLQRLALRKRIDDRLATKVVETTVSKAAQWAEQQWERCNSFRKAITDSLEMAGGGPIDPLALDQLTKAEQRVDDMGRRSLGMVDASRLDITSGGMPLGQFQEAMRSVDAMISTRPGCSRELDLDALAATPIEKPAQQG